MKHNAYIPASEIVAEVAKRCGDKALRNMSSRGYLMYVQYGLNELGFDTYFDKFPVELAIPETGIVEFPKGGFNISEMYGFNGDQCTITNRTPIYWKRNFIRKKTGSVSRSIEGQSDAFHPEHVGPNELYFYNVIDGEIHLSGKCAEFEKLFIVQHGTGGDMLEEPIIPMMFRQALIDYASVQVLTLMAPGNPVKYGQLLSFNERLLNGRDSRGLTGTWAKAKQRIASMDAKEQKDLHEYLATRAGWSEGQ